jgi:hypothetical protein
MTMLFTSLLTCPSCGLAAVEVMPLYARQTSYQCTGCGMTLRPKEGDCCVFCSYGDVPCPSVQQARDQPGWELLDSET